jgi:hypothetical protein
MRNMGTRTAPRSVLAGCALVVTLMAAAPAAAHVRILPVRGAHASAATLQASPLIYQTPNAPVMVKNISYLIFWEPQQLQTGAAATVTGTYNSLLTRYFTDIGGTRLMNVATEYSQTISGVTTNVTSTSRVGASWVDTSPYPASACSDSATPGNCLSDAQIRAEVRRAITVNGWGVGIGPTHIFYVFTAKNEGSCTGGSNPYCAFVDYCAYHGSFLRGTKNVIYANMPYTGSDLAGCGADQSPNGDIAADSTINVTSHEQMEAVTDPLLNAWTDNAGFEIGDKCAWHFGTYSYDSGHANELLHGHFYVTQQEWSNAHAGCILGE